MTSRLPGSSASRGFLCTILATPSVVSASTPVFSEGGFSSIMFSLCCPYRSIVGMHSDLNSRCFKAPWKSCNYQHSRAAKFRMTRLREGQLRVVLCRSWLQRSLDQWIAVSKEILSLRLFSAFKGNISFPCYRYFLGKGKARHSNPHAAMNHHPVTLRNIL